MWIQRCLYFLLIGAIFFSCSIYIKNHIKPFELTHLLAEDDSILQDLLKHQTLFKEKSTQYVAVTWPRRFTGPESYSELERLEQDITKALTQVEVRSLRSMLVPEFSERNLKLKKPTGNLEQQIFKPFIKRSKDQDILILHLNSKDSIDLDILESVIGRWKSRGFNSHILGHDFFQHHLRIETIRDQKKIVPIILITIFLILYLLFSSVWGALIGLLTMALSYLFTLTYIVAVDGFISPFANLALLVTVVLGISDLIHLLFHMPSKDWRYPCFLTSMTTAVGFLSLYFSDIESISRFGLFSFFGVSCSYLLTLFLTEKLLFLWKIKLVFRWPDHSRKFLIRTAHKNAALTVSIFLIILAISLWSVREFTVNENYLEQFVEQHPFSKHVEFFKSELGIQGVVDLVVDAPRSTFVNSEFSEEEVAIDSILRKEELIADFYSVGDIKRKLLADQNLTESNMERLDQLGYFDYFSPTLMNKTRWVIQIKDHSSEKIEALSARVTEKINNLKLSSIKAASFEGFSISRTRIMEKLKNTFLFSFGWTFLGTFLCFYILIGSLKYSLMAMIPNVLPVLVTLAVHIYFDLSISFFLVILSCLILSVSVDDTIHFFYFYKDEKENKITNTLNKVSGPIILTTLVFNLLFASFLFSSFKTFHQVSFSLLGAFTFALLGDLFFIPAAMKIMDKESNV